MTVIAHELTLQAGVPLIVERSVACDHGRTTLTLAQERFAIGAPQAGAWHMPVTVAPPGGRGSVAIGAPPDRRFARSLRARAGVRTPPVVNIGA